MEKINLIWQTREGDETNFELEYIQNILFKNFEKNIIIDNKRYSTVLNDSVIIYSNNKPNADEDFLNYLKKFREQGFNFYLLHLSNETPGHNCGYYEIANHVFRPLYIDGMESENITFLPVGHKSGFGSIENSKTLVKDITFSFIGQPKSDRNELLSVLERFDSKFIYKTNSWNCQTSMSVSDCKRIYNRTKFVPCPMGWEHFDSYRIWECLESKSIPILKRYNNLNYFEKNWEKSPLPVIDSWEQISMFENLSDEDYGILFEKVHQWFDEFKLSLSKRVFETVKKYKNIKKEIKSMKTYNTDKFTHGYMEIYEPLFKSMKQSKKVLEIGVYHGESLNLLELHFPDAQIYGIDIEDKRDYDDEKIKTFVCNQENREDLEKVVNSVGDDLDLIIDDGGHTMKQQQTSFGFLFSKLKPGGVYILEDLHTSRIENFGTIFPTDLITSLDMLFNFKYTGNIVSNHMTDEEREYIKNNTDSVQIWSRTPEYNQSVTAIIKKKQK